MLISADTLSKTLSLRGQTGYQHGPEIINNISKIYGYGEGAEGARAITVEDINKVTGYDPEKEGNVEGAEYAKGQVYEYGNKVTYKNNESRITYQGTKQPAEETTSEYSMFRYYDETNKTWKSLARDEKKEYTSSSYYYYPKTLTTNASGTQVGKITHNEYSTLFSFSGGSSYYWLSSRCVYTNSGIAGFGLHYVISGNNVYNYSLYFSGGSAASYTYGVRPVVTLKSDIQLEPSETANQWNIVK